MDWIIIHLFYWLMRTIKEKFIQQQQQKAIETFKWCLVHLHSYTEDIHQKR